MPITRALGEPGSSGLGQPPRPPSAALRAGAASREGPHPPHHDLGEDVPGVLAFSLQPQRAQSLLQPRRRAPSRGPFRGSWGGARARGDVVGDWGARRLWVKGGCRTLQGRRIGVSAWSAPSRERDPGSRSSPASSRLASRAKPRAHLFLLERGSAPPAL